MSFALPLMGWGLLALLPLVAIYFLKVRPTRKPATAWFLWAKVFEERRARTLFERFRDLFSLLLLITVFVAIVAAAARPYWVGDSRRDMVLLIDNSASMNAWEGRVSRLDLAKQKAADIVQGLDGNQRCSIASVADEVVFHSNLTDSPRELLDAIERITPTSVPISTAALQQFARDSTNASPRRLILSDGCWGPIGSWAEALEWLKIGTRSDGNVGIVACDLQRLPVNQAPVGVYLQVASSFPTPVNVDLVVYHESEDRLKKIVPLEIHPGINVAEVWRIEEAEDGRWFFRLEIQDQLPDDNLVFAYLPPLVPVNVAVLGEDRFFYDTSVEAFTSGERWLRLVPPPQANVVILPGGVTPTEVPDEAAWLIFNPSGESAYWQELGDEMIVGVASVKDEDHPLIRHWDPTTLAWLGAKRMRAPAGAEVLVAADDGTPLLYRTTARGRRAVVVNLDPQQADFFLSPWFPVLVYSVATQLGGAGEPKPTLVATGQDWRQFFPLAGETLEWTLPTGTTQPIATTELGNVRQPGFHRFTQGQQDWQVGVSLLHPTESLLQASPLAEMTEPLTQRWPLAFWLTCVALLVLLFESVLYHRRWVG
jgi:hypothetical protein